MTTSPIVIAGGGIAGLAAALALGRMGRAVRLLERDPQRSEEGAGLQLSPNATRRLREWGVLTALAPAMFEPHAIVVRRGRDAAILTKIPLADADARWGAPYAVIHRADLHRGLADAVANLPAVAVRSGTAVTGWSECGDFVVHAADDVQEAADALIIADGVHSILRSAFVGQGASDKSVQSGRLAWRALVPADRAPAFARAPVSNLWLGPDAHLVHYPLRDGAVVNIVAVTAGGADASPTWSQSGDRAALLQRFTSWHRSARDLLGVADGWRVWPLLSRPAPKQLVQGRVALVGDAAHPMMPFLAQGAAQAIEDAAALGEAFARHLDAPAALASYQANRLARIRRVVGASERQTRVYHLAGPAAFARDAVMRTGGVHVVAAATDWIYRG